MAQVPEAFRQIILDQLEDFNKAKDAFRREDINLQRLLTVAIGEGNVFDVSTWEIKEGGGDVVQSDLVHVPGD